jgi:acetyl esterase
VEDSLAAYRFLRSRGREIGADPGRIGVAGDSAGGNLSAVVSQLAGRSELPVPTCQVLIYPAVDFFFETASHRDLEHGHVIPRDRIVWYAEQYLRGQADRTDPRAAPVRTTDLTGQPPALVITAGFDPLRDEGRVYADRLREAGVDVVYHEYPGQIHAFISLTKVIPQGMACTLEVADYLRRHLGNA